MATAVFADGMTADGDSIAISDDISLTGACALPATDIVGNIRLLRNNSNDLDAGPGTFNHFTSGESLTVAAAVIAVAPASASSVTSSKTAAAAPVITPWTANGTSFDIPIKTTVSANGSYTVTYTVTGQTSGYVLNDSFAVTANCAPANTAPTLNLPGNMTVEGNTLGGADVTYTATASDTQDGTLTPSCSPASGDFFALGGPHTVSCSVTDSGNLTTNGSFTVTVVDTTGPAVSGPTDATVEGDTTGGATRAAGLAALGSATATDIVWGDVTASITNDAPTTFPLSTTTVTYTALDGSGNSGTTSAVLTVVDTTAPTISGTPADITTYTMSAGGKVVSYTAPTASDIVDGSVSVTCSPAAGSTFAIGSTTVTCTATDDSGNSAQSQFTVHVSLLTALWKEPINGPSVVNVAKAGRVIPVKVELFVDGVENVNTGSVTFKLWKSNSCVAAAQDAVETFTAVGEASGGSNYVWNADGGFYQYNLKTPSTAGCYRGEVYLNGELAGYFLINATK